MVSALEKQDNGTLKLTVTIPASDIAKAKEEVIEETVKSTTISGFRKGKAPTKVVEDSINLEKLREEILKKLLPNAYIKAVEEQHLKPIITPRIHVEKVEEGKDWQFIALTCEAPEISLGKYKEEIRKITAKSKIVIPGKEPQKINFDDIVKALVDMVEIKIPELIITGEVDRLLAQTLDEIKSLGLTLDQYLSSTGKTAEALREEYRKKAENDIKIEFALQKIAEEENITVEDKEIEEAIQKAKDTSERENLEKNRYLLASILRQQKVLDFLKNL